MEPPTKPLPQTPEGWDRTAEDYDIQVKADFTPHFAKNALNMALGGSTASEASSLVQKHGGPITVLDVAAGTGALAIPAAEALKKGNNQGKVIATDFASNMIKVLQNKVAESNLDNIECKVMNGEDLKLESDSIDLAFCIFGLMFFPNPAVGVKEMHRVLKKGGKIGVATWSKGNNGMRKLMEEAFSQVLPSSSSTKPPPGVLDTQESLEEVMKGAGFSVEVHKVTHSLQLATAEDFLNTFRTNPVIVGIRDNLPEEKRKELDDTIRKITEEKYKEPFSLPCEALIAIGTK